MAPATLGMGHGSCADTSALPGPYEQLCHTCNGAKNQPNLCLLKRHAFLESHETTLKQVTQKPATFQVPRHGAAWQQLPGRAKQMHPPWWALGSGWGLGTAQDPAIAVGSIDAKPHSVRFTPSVWDLMGLSLCRARLWPLVNTMTKGQMLPDCLALLSLQWQWHSTQKLGSSGRELLVPCPAHRTVALPQKHETICVSWWYSQSQEKEEAPGNAGFEASLHLSGWDSLNILATHLQCLTPPLPQYTQSYLHLFPLQSPLLLRLGKGNSLTWQIACYENDELKSTWSLWLQKPVWSAELFSLSI